jgi:uncharacterized membrane protein YhhN
MDAADLAAPTKWLLMPALLLALVWSSKGKRNRITIITAAALVFAWLGDILLATPGDVGFLAGLGAFFLTHAAYLVLFLGPLKTRRMPPLAILYAAWWVGFMVLLGPHIGALLIPVAIYGLVLGASAAASLGTNRWAAIGTLLFLCSDTLLACRLFLPGFELPQENALIMLAYLAGQGLIIVGALRATSGISAERSRQA